jgi:hypothetical protein
MAASNVWNGVANPVPHGGNAFLPTKNSQIAHKKTTQSREGLDGFCWMQLNTVLRYLFRSGTGFATPSLTFCDAQTKPLYIPNAKLFERGSSGDVSRSKVFFHGV